MITATVRPSGHLGFAFTVLVAACLAGSTATSQNFDSFDDDIIDTELWDIVTWGLDATLQETGHKLQISFAASARDDPSDAAGDLVWRGVESKCDLEGDFDIQVDFELTTWPFASGVRIGLFASGLGAVERTSLGSGADFPGYDREQYITDFAGQLSFSPTGDMSGTLRLTRIADTLTGYYWDSTAMQFVEIGSRSGVSTAPASFGVAAWTHDYVFTDIPVTLTFDDVRITAGGLCPVNSPPTADAGANVVIDSADQSTTTINGTADDDDDGDTLTCTWLEGTMILAGPTTVSGTACDLDLGTLSALSIGDHTLTLEISDGTETVTDDMVLTVSNTAPTSAPSGAGCYELGAANSIALNGDVADFDGDTLTYEWREQGSATTIASGTIGTIPGGDPVSLPGATIGTTTLGLGVHTIELSVDDGINAEVVASIDVEVKDTTGPTLALDCSRTILWPPNHQMVAVTVDPNAVDEGGAVTITASVTSNEPIDDTGDGDTTPDWDGVTVDGSTGLVSLNLRAERSGSGNGRVYTVTITATDASGNVSMASCEIVVPKSKGRNQ